MISSEGMPISEEELGIKESEEVEIEVESVSDYAAELQEKLAEADGDVVTLENRRGLLMQSIKTEQDVSELKKMIKEYDQVEEQLVPAKEKLNNAKIALKAIIKLGAELPKPDEEPKEYHIDVSKWDESLSEVVEMIGEIKDMNELIAQKDKLYEQLRQAGRAKDEEKFEQLTDSYIMICNEISDLAGKELKAAKEVDVLTEIRKRAV